jgi:tetratricopeptide (TPR) repeat protein
LRRSREILERANDLLTLLLAGSLPGDGIRLDLGLGYTALGDVRSRQGDFEHALALQQRALELMQQERAARAVDARLTRELGLVHSRLGAVHLRLGRSADALVSHRAALRLREEYMTADPSNAQARRDWTISLINVADILSDQGQLAVARDYYQRALDARLDAAGRDGGTLAQRDLTVAYDRIGEILLRMRQPRASIENYRRALAIDEALARADPGNVDLRRNLGDGHESLGDLNRELGDFVASEANYRAASEVRRQLLEDNPADVQSRRDVAQSLSKLAALYSRLDGQRASGNHRACPLYAESAALWSDLEAQKAVAATDRAGVTATRAAAHKCGH